MYKYVIALFIQSINESFVHSILVSSFYFNTLSVTYCSPLRSRTYEQKKQLTTLATNGYQHALRPRRRDFLRRLHHQMQPLAGGDNEEMRARDAKATIQSFINMNVPSDIDMRICLCHHDRKNGRLLAGDMLIKI